MRKIICTSISTACLFFSLANITYASVKVFNQSKFPVSVSYSVCIPHESICSGSWSVIGAKETGHNQLTVSTSSKNKVEILSAVEKDSDGKIIAKLHHICSSPVGTQAIYLHDYGTSHIVCYAAGKINA